MGGRGAVITGGDGEEGRGRGGIVCLATAVINFLRVEMGLSPVVHSLSTLPRMAAGYADLREVQLPTRINEVAGLSRFSCDRRLGGLRWFLRLVDASSGPVLVVLCALRSHTVT